MSGFISIRQVVKQFLYAIPFVCAMNVHAGSLCIGACPPDSGGILTVIDTPIVVGTPPVLTPHVANPPTVADSVLILPPVVQTGLFQLIPTQSAAGWQYRYSPPLGVYTSPFITIPVFSDSLLSGISGPDGWSFTSGTTDIFGLGNGAGFMTWSYTGVVDPNSYTFFSFQSAYGPATAPFQYVDWNGYTVNASGVLVPLSPLALSAGLQPYIPPNISPVPEPGTWVLMVVGLIFIYFAKRRRMFV